jgi:hypothetical protein
MRLCWKLHVAKSFRAFSFIPASDECRSLVVSAATTLDPTYPEANSRIDVGWQVAA